MSPRPLSHARNTLSPSSDAPLILIADDDDMIRDLLRTRLELTGYRTFAVRDGVEALSAIADYRPAAMVLDINMPRLDGFGVLASLQRGARAFPPTLMLTARHATADVQKAIRLGAKDFITKPFDDQTFLRRVERLLKRPGTDRPAIAVPSLTPVAPVTAITETGDHDLYL